MTFFLAVSIFELDNIYKIMMKLKIPNQTLPLKDRYVMEVPSLPDEHNIGVTKFVFSNRVGHGWACQKLANQQAIYRAGC